MPTPSAPATTTTTTTTTTADDDDDDVQRTSRTHVMTSMTRGQRHDTSTPAVTSSNDQLLEPHAAAESSAAQSSTHFCT